MGVVILLPALALSAVTGVNVYLCIVLIGVFSTVYTALGGMEAVIWTDVLQAVVLIGGALAALLITIGALDGGWREFIVTGIENNKFTLFHSGWDWTSDTLIVVVLGALFTNSLVPYTTDQSVIQRYLTTPDQKQAARAVWINGIMAVVAGILFLTVGTALFVFYKANPTRLPDLEANDQIFAVFIWREMPAGLSGLVIAGVFAAAMSSLDSSIHSISTAVTTDFIRRFKPNLLPETYLALARGLTVAFGMIGTSAAMLMAAADVEYLWDFFLGIMGLLGGTLAGLFLLAVFTKKVNTLHAWLGAIASISVLLYVKLATDLNSLLYGVVGVATCFLIGILSSRIRYINMRAAPDLSG
jgi:SSS family transporter